MELSLSTGRIRVLGLVCRKQRVDCSEELRLGCCESMVENLELERFARMWEM